MAAMVMEDLYEIFFTMKKGFVLIYAVVIVGVLFIAAVATVSSVVSEFQFAVKEIESIKAFYAADTGIECARYYQETAGAFNTTINETSYDCGVGSFTAGENPPDLLCSTKSYALFTSGSFSNNACFTFKVDAKQDLDDPQLCDVSIISRGTGSCPAGAVALERGRWETWVGLPTGSGSVTAGLAGYWEFDETSGLVAIDASGNENDGTLFGGVPAWTSSGKINGALDFERDDTDYVEVPVLTTVPPNSLDMGGNKVTLAAWVRLELGSLGTNRIVVGKPVDAFSHTNPFFSYSLEINNADRVVFRVAKSGTSVTAQSSSGAPLTNTTVWYHIAGVYNGSQLQVYVNGIKNGTATSHTNNLISYPTPLRIGVSGDILLHAFDGRIDDVRVYKRALSPAEVKRLWQM